MTYKQFLAKLRKTRGQGWRVDERRRIRNGSGECPLEAVTGTGPGCVMTASEILDLSCGMTWSIIDAADGFSNHDPTRRRDLLKALGLKEAK